MFILQMEYVHNLDDSHCVSAKVRLKQWNVGLGGGEKRCHAGAWRPKSPRS